MKLESLSKISMSKKKRPRDPTKPLIDSFSQMPLHLRVTKGFYFLGQCTNSASIPDPVPEKPSSRHLGPDCSGSGQREFIHCRCTRKWEWPGSLVGRGTIISSRGRLWMDMGQMEYMTTGKANKNLFFCSKT